MKIAAWTAGLMLGQAAAAPAAVEWDTVTGNFENFQFTLDTASEGGWWAGNTGSWTMGGGGQWADLTAENMTLGIDHIWFPMDYNDLVDATAVAACTPFMFYSDSPTIRLNLNQSFYLGFQLGYEEFGPLEYGWAELQFDGSSVSVAASATERTGLGIFAGTGQAIPEPATAGLLLLGAAAVAVRRRRG